MASDNTDPRIKGVEGLKGLKGLSEYRDLTEDEVSLLNTNTRKDLLSTYHGSSAISDYNLSEPGSYVGTYMEDYGSSQYDEPMMGMPAPEDIQENRYLNQSSFDALANGMGKMLGTAGTTFVSSLIGLPYGIGAAINQGRWSALWDNSVTKGLADVDSWLEENMTNYRSKAQQDNPWYNSNNLISMNFIADDVIKNAGFTLGAAASMAVGSGSLGLMARSMGFVNDVSKAGRVTNNVLSALFSATGEGMIEARQGVEERNKLEFQRFDDALAPEYESLKQEFEAVDAEYAANRNKTLVRGADGNVYDPAYESYKLKMQDLNAKRDELNQKREAGRKQIIESGQDMGNSILLANQVLLSAGNLIQFSKGMTKSFDRARHAAEQSSKYARPTLTGAQRVSSNIRDGYKVTSPWAGRTVAATKGIVTEGSEEMNQQWIQSSSGAAYNEADVNDYWKAKLDHESYRETTKGLYTLGNILDRGFQESWGDLDQWQQFVVGGLTGMMGSYSPTKLFNQDKQYGIFDPRRYGSWEGGAFNEIRDFNKEYNQYKENIDEVNKILQSENFPERMSSMVGHTYTEREKEYLVEQNDKKGWKDADDKQNIHDIQAFLRAGKLDDLRAIYQEMGTPLTDEDIDGLVKATTRKVTAEEDLQQLNSAIDEEIGQHQRRIDELYERIADIRTTEDNFDTEEEKENYRSRVESQLDDLNDKLFGEYSAIANLESEKASVGHEHYVGAYVDENGNQTVTNDEIRAEHQHNAEELERKLNSYLDSIDTVNKMTNGRLTKDQEDNLAYLHNISAEKTVRVDKIMNKVRKQLPSKFLLKTNKTPEQLQKQFASSDLAFGASNKEGYVEVDTSMMNDKAFSAFFIDNIISGQNIDAKTEEEGQKESEEQLRTNEQMIRQAFVNNAMQKNGQSLEQALHSQEYDQLIDDINDAVQLHSEAAQFYKTYLEYMLNPQKVDQAKAREEKKADEKAKKEKVDGASLDDMLSMSDVDLGAILSDSKKGKNKSGNKARKALGMKNGRAKAQAELDKAVKAGTLDEETASDATKLLDEQLGRMSQEDDDADMSSMDAVVSKMFDLETDAMNDEEVLLSEEEEAAINSGSIEFDEAAYSERVAKAKDALASITDKISKEIQEIEDSIDKGTLAKALDDDEAPSEKAEKAVQRAADEDKAKNNPTPPRNPKSRSEAPEPLKPVTTVLKSRKEQEENPVTFEGNKAMLGSDKLAGETGKNIPESEKPSWHPWMSSTSEVGQYTNEPYQPNPNDPEAAFKKQRYDAIRKKLESVGAYQRRKEGRIKQGMPIGFVVFQDVNDEAGDFVVFITDEHGNIIGDLPSNDPRLATSKRDVPMDALYEEIRKEWEDADEDDRKNGMKSRFTSQVDHVLVGKVLYQNERQSVAQLFEGKSQPVLFAVKTGASIASGSLQTQVVNAKQILYPKTGSAGQPYILIETPGMHETRKGFKYYAVPVATKTIGEMDPNSKYIKVLRQLLNRIKKKDLKGGVGNDVEAKKLLQELLAVANVHVNLVEGSNTRKELGIRITVLDENKKKVPVVIHTGKREDMDIDAIMQKLAGVRANFSLDYINGANSKKIKHLLTVDGQMIGDYNEIMAEIADTNAADTRTVNDWFTVRPLVKRGDDLVMSEAEDVKTEWANNAEVGVLHVSVKIQGFGTREWTVDTTDNFRVFDEKGDEVIPTKENGSKHSNKEKTMAAIIAAEAFGAHYGMNSDTPFAVTLWGQTQIYDPRKRRFSKKKDVETILKEANAEGRQLTEAEKFDIIREYLEEHEYDPVTEPQGTEPQKEDHTAEVMQKLAEMEEETSHYKLVRWDEKQEKYVEDANGDYYQDDRNGCVHARVSNVNDADVEVIEANQKAGFGKVNPQLKTASTGAGNAVDRFVREFFRGGDLLKGIGIIKDSFDKLPTEIKSKIEDSLRGINEPNISHEAALNLAISLHNLAESLGADWEINSTGLVASGIVSFDGETSVAVAGTIDLLAYNPKTGQYAIIDMKSSLAPLFTKDGKVRTDVKTKAKMEHWRAQQTLYKNFLEKKFGIKISGLRILPFSVTYSTKFGETDYQVENGVLKDRGYTVDIQPAYMGKMIQLTPKANVTYQTAQLPDSVKRLMPKKPISKPAEEEVEVKGQLIDLRDSVPEGATLKQFISKEYADNQDVQNLADILDANKTDGKPVLMTMASQELLLKAIDRDALDKAIQEAEALKHQIHIDVPAGTEFTVEDALEKLRKASPDAAEALSSLPEELLLKLSDISVVNIVAQMYDEGSEIEQIYYYISSLPEAVKHKKAKTGEYKRLNLQHELRWLNKNLPQVSKERKLQIIKGLIACSDGTMDFGRVQNGIMTIGTLAEEGTVYHEAFHYVVQFLMTDEEIDTMYKEAEKRYGKMPVVALEERLADDFADYVRGIDPEESRIKRFFRELWNAIKAMFGNRPYIETLYRNINTGVYSGKEFRDDRRNVFTSVNDESRQSAKMYEYLTDSERERIKGSDISPELWNSLDKGQQEYMLHCVI